MKTILSILLLILQIQSFANMANPVKRGTSGSSPFVNEYVDVVKEDLFIKIDKDLKKASFNVKYYINSSKDGRQIPFIFIASKYLDSFSVKIDDKEVMIKDTPYESEVRKAIKFNDFSYLFEKPGNEDSTSAYNIESSIFNIGINPYDIIYFETDISKGSHVIEVNYLATSWADTYDWINEYSFYYELSPAKYWKSFGVLNVKIDFSEFDEEVSTNLGEPINGSLDSIAEWHFNGLPSETIQIKINPEMNIVAKLLTLIHPTGLALITGILLIIFHVRLIIRNRRKSKPSSLVVTGSILVPLIALFSFIIYFGIIDLIIGKHAGGYHGYKVFVLGLYPIIMPLYWIIIRIVDRNLKLKLEAK